jgi:dolichyl-phosphate-mannose-protein mannosyltransferase
MTVRLSPLKFCTYSNVTAVVKYFLLGNPFVYWGSTASLGVFGLIVAWYLVRWQRGYNDLKQSEIDQIHYSGIYPVIGWVLHYLPFMAMGRVTYVHHYYPALWFAILTMGFCLDWTTRKLNKQVNWAIFGTLYIVIIGLYWLFRAISFGMVGSHKQWAHLKWLDSWRMTD